MSLFPIHELVHVPVPHTRVVKVGGSSKLVNAFVNTRDVAMAARVRQICGSDRVCVDMSSEGDDERSVSRAAWVNDDDARDTKRQVLSHNNINNNNRQRRRNSRWLVAD